MPEAIALKVVHEDPRRVGRGQAGGSRGASGRRQSASIRCKMPCSACDPALARAAARRHHSSTRQGHQRPAGRRAHARGAYRPDASAHGALGVARIPGRVRGRDDRRRHHRGADRPASQRPAAHGGAPRRPAGDHALSGARALPSPHLSARPARDGQDPPDPPASRASALSRSSATRCMADGSRVRGAPRRSSSTSCARSSARPCMRHGWPSTNRAPASGSRSRARVPADFAALLEALRRDARRRQLGADRALRVGSWLTPDWPAPPGVRALSTLRGGGVSALSVRISEPGRPCRR